MAIDPENPDAGDEKIENLPARPADNSGDVKGGATTTAPPSGPVPIPYPNTRVPGSPRLIVPCI